MRSARIGLPSTEWPITVWRRRAAPREGARRRSSAAASIDTSLSMVAALDSALAERAAAHGRVAIDTEFVSERRYQALLCLAQVAVPDPDAPDGVRTEVLDPLGDDPPDPAPLARVLADPDVEVVVHAGRQDIAILRRTWNTEVTRVFDTQLAAGFIGFGNQEGYESLVRKVLGVRLKGSEGFTKWDRRPLTAQQLEYAADDARLLLGAGRGDRAPARGARPARLGARGVPGARGVDATSATPTACSSACRGSAGSATAARAVARELVEWREETARAMDRPPGYVLPDHALIELARRAPADRNGLEQIRGLPAQTLHRRGDQLLGAIARGRERAGARRPRPSRARASPPTRRWCRWPRRWCATARWRRAWRSS